MAIKAVTEGLSPRGRGNLQIAAHNDDPRRRGKKLPHHTAPEGSIPARAGEPHATAAAGKYKRYPRANLASYIHRAGSIPARAGEPTDGP